MGTMEQGLILANREHIQSKPHQLVTCALFCIVGSSVYVVYMIMNRLVQLALASIESRPYHADGIAQYTEEEGLLSEPQDAPASEACDDRIHREDIISGMYMGGLGAFLSVPGLCMWDVPTTGAFLTALQLGGVWERIKVSLGSPVATLWYSHRLNCGGR